MQLEGFNNLTKCLSFNLYDFCVASCESERKSYIEFLKENYSAGPITKALKGICEIIEANVISVSDQDYDPWGASSLVLMSDVKGSGVGAAASSHMHLDKSHICAHTYPDFDFQNDLCSIRIDIDIATCGEISPLNALNFMFQSFETDIVVVDYVVRGFTRDSDGKRIFMDHEVRSIQDFIAPEILKQYECVDLNIASDNIWQTKMQRVEFDTDEYFVEPKVYEGQKQDLLKKIQKEMRDILFLR